MSRMHSIASFAFAGLLGVAVIGCDDTVSSKKTVDKAPDGTTTTVKESVKQDDGKTTVKKEVDVDRPGLDKPGDHTEKKVTVDTDK